jgi:peptide/nickel transport system permease protein
VTTLLDAVETAPAPSEQRRAGRGKIVAGSAIVAVFVIGAACASWIAPDDPLRQDLLDRLAQPGGRHLLGTDALGRDVFSRLVYAARVDLRVGALCAVVPMLLGTVLGALAGYFGGLLDAVIARVIDLVQSFPILVFLLALLGAIGPAHSWLFLGPGELPVVIAFGCLGWVVYARLIRGEVLRVRDLEYVQAARAGGVPRWRVLLRHVLPNVINQTVVYVVLDVGLAVLALSTLSFLGLGIPQPIAEWGAMIADGRPRFAEQWWLVVAPGVAISIFGFGLALLGDGLDDRLK